MMVLTDASRHDWLEGRGPELTLIGFQDDATSQILSAHFQLEPENTLGYFHALRAMVTTHGVPLSVYRDRHGIFQRNDPHWTLAEQLAGKQCPTHLARALEELGIQQIPAYSPQAKGRIERAWRTCQDRLVSELVSPRPAISTPPTKSSPASAPTISGAFRRPGARGSVRLSRSAPRFDLARCLSFRYQRVVGPDHVIRFGARSIALPALPSKRGYAGAPVELSHQMDGRLLVTCRKILLLSLPWPLPLLEDAGRRPAPRLSRQKTKKTMPRIYHLGGRPAVA